MNNTQTQRNKGAIDGGLLALDPRCLGMAVEAQDKASTMTGDKIAVVYVRGPITSHPEFASPCDDYDSILRRAELAFGSDARAVVLSIDSPGGAVAGCFPLARRLRAMAEATNKPFVAYVDGSGCSAAYAIAAAAERIYVTDAALLGSVGIIDVRVDVSANNAAAGVRVDVITSGERKAYGHPNAPVTSTELTEKQALVDGIASIFFELIAEFRGLKASAVEAMNAGVFLGSDAVRVGLADAVVTSLDDVLAEFAGESPRTVQQPRGASAGMAAHAPTQSGLNAMRSNTMSAPPKPPVVVAPPRSAPQPPTAPQGSIVHVEHAEHAELSRAEYCAYLDARMGVSKPTLRATVEGNTQTFGAVHVQVPQSRKQQLDDLDLRMGTVRLVLGSKVEGNVQTFGLVREDQTIEARARRGR